MKNILARGGIEFLAVFVGIIFSLYVDENRDLNIVRGNNKKNLRSLEHEIDQRINYIDNKISQTPAGIILGNNSIKQHFVEINMGFIDGYEWIELTPKDLEAQYKSIKMGFDNDKLGMMIIIDNLEQISRIDFSDLKKNISLPLNIFNFEVPDNIDIFDETK